MIRMGVADPLPTIAQRRSWEHIDDRVPPADDEADGNFATFVQWVNKASSWIGWTGARCFDTKDRPCRNGGDFMRARDEDAFPVRWYMPNRFPEPVVPDARTMRVREAVAAAGPSGASDDDLRASGTTAGMSAKRVAAALEGRAVRLDDRWTMDDAGIAQTLYEAAQARRARCLR